MLMEWASSERDNRSFSKFANDAGLINERGAYRTLRSRLAYSTRRLVNTGFIEYKSKKPEERSFYFASGKDFNPDDFAGKYGVTAIFGKLKKRISADEIVKQTSYSLRYVHRVVEWLVDNGYVIVEGWPAAESSALYGTWKSRRLLAHLERSMGLVGFQPQANGVGSVWDAPRIDVPGLVDYRREL
ncbi:hypothetical protein HYT84_00250, partial [Candidatus Micrarchaeota archaeon]|nr:hypothetical protein [Candidatus Micrarchaeota archaeon]